MIVTPHEPANTGQLVVAKMIDDGVVLRRYAALPHKRIRLIPNNERYPTTEHDASEFHWIYPVHSTIRLENA